MGGAGGRPGRKHGLGPTGRGERSRRGSAPQGPSAPGRQPGFRCWHPLGTPALVCRLIPLADPFVSLLHQPQLILMGSSVPGPPGHRAGCRCGRRGRWQDILGQNFRALLGTAFPAGTPRLPASPGGAAVGVGRGVRPPPHPGGRGDGRTCVTVTGAAGHTQRPEQCRAPGSGGQCLRSTFVASSVRPSSLPSPEPLPRLRHQPPATWAAIAVVPPVRPPFSVPPLTGVPEGPEEHSRHNPSRDSTLGATHKAAASGAFTLAPFTNRLFPRGRRVDLQKVGSDVLLPCPSPPPSPK